MLRVQDFRPYMRVLVHRKSSLTGKQALSVMRTEGVSSIALIDGKGFRSSGIVQRRVLYEHIIDHGAPPEHVRALATPAGEVDLATPLEEVMRIWNYQKFVLVRDETNRFRHIITSRVLAQLWSDYAGPFSQIDQTENRLRQIVASLGPELIFQTVQLSSVDSLNPRDYERLFRVHWERLPFRNLDKDVVCKALVAFAEFRNRVMHFRLRTDSDGGQVDEDVRRLVALRRLLMQNAPA